MRWPWQTKRARPLCSNHCGRRATHVALAGNLVAFVCPICAGLALQEAPGTKAKPLEAYQP